MASNEEIEDFIVNGEIKDIVSKKGTSKEVAEALAELIQIGKLWGMERAIKEVQLKYSPEVVSEAVKHHPFLEIGLPEPSSLSAPVDAAILAVKEANKGK